jgi:hypothetical protein
VTTASSLLLLLSKPANVGGDVGKLALGEWHCRHRVRSHNMRHDRTGALAFFVCDFVKGRNICIGEFESLSSDWLGLSRCLELHFCIGLI